jgi:hypothetical protein
MKIDIYQEQKEQQDINMRKLTEFEKQMLINLKSDLMDSNGHNKTNIQQECKAELEANEILIKVIRGE